MAVIPDHQAPIFKEAAANLNKMLKSELEEDARLVQKGLMLYRQGTVHHLKYMVKSIWATVQDVTPVRVYINVLDPEESSCTCLLGRFAAIVWPRFFRHIVMLQVCPIGSKPGASCEGADECGKMGLAARKGSG